MDNSAPSLDPDDEPPDFPLAPEDRNFIAAHDGGEEFQGAPLQPWNPPRKIAAQCMGMLYPFIGEEGFIQITRNGTYPGVLKDTIIFLWLRVLLPGETPGTALTRAKRAQRRPDEAWQQAEEWADQAGMFSLASREFQEAFDLFASKMAAELAMRGTPEAAAAAGDGAEADQKKSNPEPLGAIPYDGLGNGP